MLVFVQLLRPSVLGRTRDIWNGRRHLLGCPGRMLATSATAEPRTRNPPGRGADGLIYVTKAPNGNRIGRLRPRRSRTFRAHGMNDEENRRAGGRRSHLRQCHGAGDASRVGPEPEAAPLRGDGPGLEKPLRVGQRVHTTTSGIGRGLEDRTPPPGTWLLRHALRLRVGTGEEPRRRLAVAVPGTCAKST